MFCWWLAVIDVGFNSVHWQARDTHVFCKSTTMSARGLALPPELISEIFNSTIRPSIHHSPHLSQVCAQWRAVALATPSLWTTLTISCQLKNFSEILDIWIPRSGVHHVTLRLCGDPTRMEEESSEAIKWALEHHSSKIKHLELCFTCPDHCNTLKHHLRTLRHIKSAHIERGVCSHPPKSRIAFFHSCPQLTTLALQDIGLTWIDLPWTQLTSFTASSSSLTTPVVVVLKHAPNLLHFEITFIPWTSSSDAVEPPFLHPRVQRAVLHCQRPGNTPLPLLSSYTFPALRVLEISSSSQLDPYELEEFLERSDAPLESLSLVADSFSKHLHTVLPLARLQHLTTLRLWHIRTLFASDFFVTFSYDPTFLPRLEHLTMGCAHTGESDEEADLAYLPGRAADSACARRRLVGVALCAVYIVAERRGGARRELSAKDRRRCAQLRAEGIDIFVTVN
uniref:F-box domain-containing protein n=1 Tax=Mycena chlorophos TaxID=658473 RepID=A0ABQ0M5B9_MYCCL|nr:predicted protein [Mycena chlorophos]